MDNNLVRIENITYEFVSGTFTCDAAHLYLCHLFVSQSKLPAREF